MNKAASFEFDEVVNPITKFKSYRASHEFREICLPIIFAHVKPIEVFFAAVVNQFAPIDSWGLMDTMIQSEKEIDRCVLPAFKIMLRNYIPDRLYTDAHLDGLLDFNTIYQAVHDQIHTEDLVAHYLKRKMDMIQEIMKYTNIKVNVGGLVGMAEQKLKDAILRQGDPDKEFAGFAGMKDGSGK